MKNLKTKQQHAFGLIMLIITPTLFASPIATTYQTTGTSGDWTYDFTFTNNTGNQYLYFLGVDVQGGSITKGPSLFFLDYNGWSIGSVSYNIDWLYQSDYNAQTIHPGTSLNGFTVHDTAVNAKTEINAFAYGYNYGIPYTGTDFQSGNNINPGFTTVAFEATQAVVPLPPSIALFATGLFGFATCVRLNKRHQSPI